MSDPEDALASLAEQLRGEGSLISERVVDPAGTPPVLGRLAAAGPRTASAPAEYATVVEAVREGYLLHYATPRLIAGSDPELALLAGDYLYALGLERLAAVGDLDAVGELADLISLCAQLHVEGRDGGATEALWLGAAVAIAAGSSPAHRGAKAALREGREDGPEMVLAAAREAAAGTPIAEPLEAASEAIDFGARRG